MMLGIILPMMLAACGGEGKRIPPLAPHAKVLAFGDSLTEGVGARPDASYPAVLERLIERTVINAGVPGEISQQGLARLPALLEEHDPALLILCHGGNDLLQGIPLEQVEENVRSMIRLARDRGKEAILIGVPKPGLLLSVPGFYEEIAEDFEIPFEGEILEDLLSTPAMKSDTIHPNSAGYKRLAEAIAVLIDQESSAG
jgi:lysophospholipase L1-like esterase